MEELVKQFPLLGEYLGSAWYFACIHLSLFLVCICLWLWDIFVLVRDVNALRATFHGDGSVTADETTHIGRLWKVVSALAQKGQLLSPDSIRVRLQHRLGSREVPLRVCINAFVISGLIGTLYNLWSLGPAFSDWLAKGEQSGKQFPIGIAFAASVFGLSYALIMSLIDGLFIRSARTLFTRRASATIFDFAAREFPETEQASVAKALNHFFDTSQGFLAGMQLRHEELTAKLVEQVRDSSGQLSGTMATVGEQWSAVTSAVTEKITVLAMKFETSAASLHGAVAKMERTLETASNRLEEVEHINVTLSQVRLGADTLLSEISARMNELGHDWRSSLQEATGNHMARVESLYDTLSTRYEARSAERDRRSDETFDRFASSLSTSIEEWKLEREAIGPYIETLLDGWRKELGETALSMQKSVVSIGPQIDTLLNGWRAELGRTAASLDAGLSDLREASTKAAESQAGLERSAATAFQTLESVSKVVAGFGETLTKTAPYQKAVEDMTRAISRLQSSLAAMDQTMARLVSIPATRATPTEETQVGPTPLYQPVSEPADRELAGDFVSHAGAISHSLTQIEKNVERLGTTLTGLRGELKQSAVPQTGQVAGNGSGGRSWWPPFRRKNV